jgi:hypothetical protein
MALISLVHGEDQNLFAANINTRKKKRENIFGFIKNAGPELNNEKIKKFSYRAG